MELSGKKFLVIGLARTGIELPRFLTRQGAKVVGSDLRPQSELKQTMETLAGLPIEYRLGGEDRNWLAEVDYVIPGPGVAKDNPVLREAVNQRVPVLSEIELA